MPKMELSEGTDLHLCRSVHPLPDSYPLDAKKLL